MDDMTIEVTKLAAELETVKLLGVLLFFLAIALVALVVAVSRNMRSQDKQNEQSVEASFGIIGKLVDKLEVMLQTSVSQTQELLKVSTVLDTMDKRLTSLHDKHDAVLLLLVPPTTSAHAVVEEPVKTAEG